jgi:dTDP-glucose pyrophosphorylase
MITFPERVKARIVDAHKTIIQTMKTMDDCRSKSLLVFDEDHFLGLITNGDLQRAIIANLPFDTTIGALVDNAKKKYAHLSDGDESIKAWMMEVRAEMMPILDDGGKLVKVIFWEDLFEESRENNRKTINIPVVIMAGGKGTRLKPLTNVLPKPLIPIGKKTILEEILDRFEAVGCRKFYMSINYKSDMIRFYVEQLEHHYDIEFFEEPKPLGTIGSVSLLKGRIDTPFFVSNCDIIIDQDYRDVYDYHIANKNDLTVVAAVKSFKIPYGVIETGKDGLMTGLQEKPEITYQINSGVYILNPDCIDEIPENEFFHITHLMEIIQKRGGRIGCFPVSEQAWTDMGEWSEYMKVANIH